MKIHTKIHKMPKFLEFITGGARAITLLPFGIFVREDCLMNAGTINHELIHREQQKEMLIIFFYLWYLTEWFIRIFINGRKAYKNILFEKEAFANDDNYLYLETRKQFNWIRR